MERATCLLTILLVLISRLLPGQTNEKIYKAFLTGDMATWKQAMDSIDAIRARTNEELLELVNYQYGYIGWCIESKKHDDARKYKQKASGSLEKLAREKSFQAVVYAYKAAFAGFEIGLYPYKAPFVGPKSLEYGEKAVLLDTLNALGYIQLGNIAWYSPAVFGGSKTKALTHYSKALKIMESNSRYTLNNWNYLHLLVTLIQAYVDMNDYAKAESYCLKALAVEPNFDWVKYKLYPGVLKKRKQ